MLRLERLLQKVVESKEQMEKEQVKKITLLASPVYSEGSLLIQTVACVSIGGKTGPGDTLPTPKYGCRYRGQTVAINGEQIYGII